MGAGGGKAAMRCGGEMWPCCVASVHYIGAWICAYYVDAWVARPGGQNL